MASDEALRGSYSDYHYSVDDDDDAGMYAYYSDEDAGGDEEGEEEPRPPARRKRAGDRRAPRGPLRSVRRRTALPPGCGGAGPWGGKQRRKLLAWRLRGKDQRRQARERARWSGVKAPPGLLDPIFLDLEIDLGDD
uniref:Uncharacterized protein n=1 Tax=Triticum urartu TaxID=4572 RepID=A0A8R7V485_TRIUA